MTHAAPLLPTTGLRHAITGTFGALHLDGLGREGKVVQFRRPA